MPKLEWLFICEYALIDKANKLSILGEFTSVYFKEFPASFPSIYIVTRWKGERGETFNEKIRISDSGGSVVAEAVFPVVEITGDRSTNLHKFEMLRFDKPGEYFVEAYSNDAFAGKERFFARSQGE